MQQPAIATSSPDPPNLKLIILDLSRSTRTSIEVASDALVQRLARAMAPRMDLPLVTDTGETIEYVLVNTRTEGEGPLQPQQTLDEAGVVDGDTLHLQIAPPHETQQKSTSRRVGQVWAYQNISTRFSSADAMKSPSRILEELLANGSLHKSLGEDASAEEIRDSLRTIRELLVQLLSDVAAARQPPSTASTQADQAVFFASSLPKDDRPNIPHLDSSSREISEALRRLCELLESSSVLHESARSAELTVGTLEDSFEKIISRLEDRLGNIATEASEAPRTHDINVIEIDIPAEEKKPIRMVRIEKLHTFERSRNEESRWRSNAHLFVGGALGILVNWATSQDHEISDISLVVVGFFVFIAGYCFLSAKNWHRTVEEHKIDETDKDDSHDKVIRPVARPLAKKARRRSRKQRGSGHGKG